MDDSVDWGSPKKLRSSNASSSKDWISGLDNDCIQKILEFLPVKDCIKFCSCSRRWESLWKSIANLSFTCDSYELKKAERFASFVDKSLAANASKKIKKFSLDFGFYRSFKEQADSWILFAGNHEVEELCLGSFDLTQGFRNISWKSVKFLSLTHSGYDSDNILAIFEGSPLLESLTLRRCRPYHNPTTIIATGASLKELVIDGLSKEMTILAPYLEALTVVETCSEIQFKLLDVSTLKEATVERHSSVDLNGGEKRKLKAVLQKLIRVNKFTVGIGMLQAFSIMKLSRERVPKLNLKVLQTSMELKKEYIHGLLALLSRCPALEHLTIEVKPSSNFEFNPEGLDPDKCFTGKNRLSGHLKNVKITRFVAGSSSEEVLLQLGKYFLGNAKKLKKLIINAEEHRLTSKPEKLQKMLEITETLLSLPRTSPDAVIMFKSGLR